MPMDRIPVDLGSRGYGILVGAGALDRLGEELAPLWRGGPVFCVADERVWRLYGAAVQAALRPTMSCSGLTFRSGEPSKTWATAGRLLRELAAEGMARDGLVLSLGGGVAGDLAGFVAASYARGVDFVQLPTTLLAQVDSSVGGKTGVNLPEGKNLVGAFHQPRLVVCDPLTLASLPRREIRCGLAEALKHGFIADAAYLAQVESLSERALCAEPAALGEIAAGSCRVKAAIVVADEREAGLRATLNFGHTIGHAIEKVGGYRRYRHGEAVAVGMVGAAMVGARMGACDGSLVDRVRSAMGGVGLPTAVPGLDADELLQAISHDKKTERGRVRWVLPIEVGRVTVTPEVPGRTVVRTLRELVG